MIGHNDKSIECFSRTASLVLFLTLYLEDRSNCKWNFEHEHL